jgi:histidinol dehydrogenase
MRIANTKDAGFKKIWRDYLLSSSAFPDEIQRKAADIVGKVRQQGDKALFEFTRKYDRCLVNSKTVRLSSKGMKQALRQVSRHHLKLMKRAASRITEFHKLQALNNWELKKDGARMGMRWNPLDRVGIYVPGGQAAYPSTVLMNAIPAKIAGVQRIVMVNPSPKGKINPYTIAAASVAGVNEIYHIGGAQAIAALAYGTKTIPSVDKIVGPGNAYVAAAKKLVYGQVGIDMIAGPTEVMIVADGASKPDYVASDLISQAEHDPMARPVLVTTSTLLLKRVLNALGQQMAKTERSEIVKQSVVQNGLAILARSRREALDLINDMAPEHLLLMVNEAKKWLKDIVHAGAIFLGEYTPAAAGDYLMGPNHVLPTGRTARFASPLGVYDFMKASSWLELSRRGLEKYGSDLIEFTELEGLTAHGDSVRIRTKGK